MNDGLAFLPTRILGQNRSVDSSNSEKNPPCGDSCGTTRPDIRPITPALKPRRTPKPLRTPIQNTLYCSRFYLAHHYTYILFSSRIRTREEQGGVIMMGDIKTAAI